jgi:hypothetical protein
MLSMGPFELRECPSMKTYLSLYLKYSIDEDGLKSICPFLSIRFNIEGTPSTNS